MACDSAYCAYLKAYYPFEFYFTQLKLYTEKKDRDKIAALINEMRHYAGITLTAGKFGQDNRDWFVDKTNKTISQSISSIKYISKSAANDLYDMKDVNFDSFVDLLRYIRQYTCLDSRQIDILIRTDYFDRFGSAGKLLKVFKEYSEGTNKITPTLVEKTVVKRLDALRKYELSAPEEELTVCQKLNVENDNIGICISTYSYLPSDYTNTYYVLNVDDTYGVKAKLYSVMRGTTGTVRFRKDMFQNDRFENGDIVTLIRFEKKQQCVYSKVTVNGKTSTISTPIEGAYDIWATNYRVDQTKSTMWQTEKENTDMPIEA